MLGLCSLASGSPQHGQAFSLCYNHSILFVTQWHQFLFPPWLKNAEHAGAGQRLFSRIAFFSLHSLAQTTRVFRKQHQNKCERRQTRQSAPFILKKEEGKSVILMSWMENQEADLKFKSSYLFMGNAEVFLFTAELLTLHAFVRRSYWFIMLLTRVV